MTSADGTIPVFPRQYKSIILLASIYIYIYFYLFAPFLLELMPPPPSLGPERRFFRGEMRIYH